MRCQGGNICKMQIAAESARKIENTYVLYKILKNLSVYIK